MTALIPSLMDNEKLLSVFANVAAVLPAMVSGSRLWPLLSERRQKGSVQAGGEMTPICREFRASDPVNHDWMGH